MARIAAVTTAAAFIAFVFTLSACSASSGPPDVVAVVDGEPLTETDMELASSEAGADAGGREAFELAVRNKALAALARKSGVVEDPGYKEAVRAFSERELVKTLMDRKRVDLAAATTVTDEEVAEFASRMCYRISFLIAELGGRREAERFVRAAKGGVARWQEEVSAVGCQDVDIFLMGEIYQMEKGEVRLVARGKRFTVVKLTEKKKVGGVSELTGKEAVKESLIRKKVDEALERWADKVADGADVRVLRPDAVPEGGPRMERE